MVASNDIQDLDIVQEGMHKRVQGASGKRAAGRGRSMPDCCGCQPVLY
jgi:hypothetical protein